MQHVPKPTPKLHCEVLEECLLSSLWPPSNDHISCGLESGAISPPDQHLAPFAPPLGEFTPRENAVKVSRSTRSGEARLDFFCSVSSFCCFLARPWKSTQTQLVCKKELLSLTIPCRFFGVYKAILLTFLYNSQKNAHRGRLHR